MRHGKLALLAFICIALVDGQSSDPDAWWRAANVYQISPVSFKDSNNDGYGDIQGIISKLDYLVDTGVDVLFLSPFYTTPFKDFGYDISDYINVDPKFGTDEDVDELLRIAGEKGLKVIIDFVPNHSSIEHSWFVKSENRERGFENFYVWHDGKPATLGRPLPPNDWLSVYGGSSWQWSEKRSQYYYHAFAKEQPDLNLREQRVIDELEKTIEFWLQKGVDGFRLDAVSHLFEDPAFVRDPEFYNNLPPTYALVEKWRELVDNYTKTHGGDSIVWAPQVWNSDVEALRKYHVSDTGTPRAQIPTNFILINELNQSSRAADYKETIDKYMNALPEGAVGNWFLGTHDHSRVASRMGLEQVHGLTFLQLTLPGIAFIYNGDEIAMVDYRDISWYDTMDPWACNTNDPSDFSGLSRDPARTPFQWDYTANAGFNQGAPTWIPVYPYYYANNLAFQMVYTRSFYKIYKQLLHVRKTATFVTGDFQSKVLSENVFGFTRSTNDETFVVLINTGNQTEAVNVNELTVKLADESEILVASLLSDYEDGDIVTNNNVQLNAFDAVILKARSAGTTITLSLLAIVAVIVKLFL